MMPHDDSERLHILRNVTTTLARALVAPEQLATIMRHWSSGIDSGHISQSGDACPATTEDERRLSGQGVHAYVMRALRTLSTAPLQLSISEHALALFVDTHNFPSAAFVTPLHALSNDARFCVATLLSNATHCLSTSYASGCVGLGAPVYGDFRLNAHLESVLERERLVAAYVESLIVHARLYGVWASLRPALVAIITQLMCESTTRLRQLQPRTQHGARAVSDSEPAERARAAYLCTCFAQLLRAVEAA